MRSSTSFAGLLVALAGTALSTAPSIGATLVEGEAWPKPLRRVEGGTSTGDVNLIPRRCKPGDYVIHQIEFHGPGDGYGTVAHVFKEEEEEEKGVDQLRIELEVILFNATETRGSSLEAFLALEREDSVNLCVVLDADVQTMVCGPHADMRNVQLPLSALSRGEQHTLHAWLVDGDGGALDCSSPASYTKFVAPDPGAGQCWGRGQAFSHDISITSPRNGSSSSSSSRRRSSNSGSGEEVEEEAQVAIEVDVRYVAETYTGLRQRCSLCTLHLHAEVTSSSPLFDSENKNEKDGRGGVAGDGDGDDGGGMCHESSGSSSSSQGYERRAEMQIPWPWESWEEENGEREGKWGEGAMEEGEQFAAFHTALPDVPPGLHHLRVWLAIKQPLEQQQQQQQQRGQNQGRDSSRVGCEATSSFYIPSADGRRGSAGGPTTVTEVTRSMSSQERFEHLLLPLVDKSLVIVTAANGPYFPRVANLVGSVHYWEPHLRVLLYDLGGFSEEEQAEMQSWAHVTVLKLPTATAGMAADGSGEDGLPEHFNIPRLVAWKAWATLQAIDAYGYRSVMWIDANTEIRRPLHEVRRVMRQDGYFLTIAGRTFPSSINVRPQTREALGCHAEEHSQVECTSALMGFMADSWAVASLLRTLHEGCSDLSVLWPEGATFTNQRRDQSVLNALICGGAVNGYGNSSGDDPDSTTITSSTSSSPPASAPYDATRRRQAKVRCHSGKQWWAFGDQFDLEVTSDPTDMNEVVFFSRRAALPKPYMDFIRTGGAL